MKNLKSYKLSLIKALQNIDIKVVGEIETLIHKKITQGRQIFTCGNGGAASVSNHFLCDFNKGIKLSSENKLKPKVISLSNDIENILAISNDLKFDKIFSFQLDNYCKPGDLLITFSCSGTSSNIINVIKYAKSKKLQTISFTGFASKKIRKITDLNIDANIKNYGVAEDIFQSLMHMISQSIRLKFVLKKNKKIIL
jgi:D-sedoheptulose 7-phosphate isomerase